MNKDIDKMLKINVTSAVDLGDKDLLMCFFNYYRDKIGNRMKT